MGSDNQAGTKPAAAWPACWAAMGPITISPVKTAQDSQVSAQQGQFPSPSSRSGAELVARTDR